jgi:DNA polymerase III sliding clamp (beta) subunit (PCNA family)
LTKAENPIINEKQKKIMGNLIIETKTKAIEVKGFDSDNELEIEIQDEPIWLNKDQVIELIDFLKAELEKLEDEQ